MKKRIQKKLHNKSINYSLRTGYEIPKFKSWHHYKNFIDKCVIKIIGEAMSRPLKKSLHYTSIVRNFLEITVLNINK